ncbi:poly-beta-1,6 N-acetyl-D-glucosamine export porin PgaA [Kluyvera georgiana]|uniref:poly-beta-1,6 N-acetyl-D-glucosamine export porin PgaA n=1 Tax=Kluyvera georgiana TaxID=73098 RepID=UPI0023037CBF|nr:poly-beta-1,6 N-acetyl-D-glucosamine export porin PgaA [Kluyvera georgiana]MDA8495215.1 poly-beta-1,6 N-acetyl-D-glucosamine export porin PgaA [Kluyvera georgiana]
MDSPSHHNKARYYRNSKLSLSFSLVLLIPGLVYGSQSIYEQQIQQARSGNYSPFLTYVERYQQHNALNAGQVADWLQVALWAGRDRDVIQVWQRYQVYMPIPARGVAAAAQSARNLQQWQTALSLWQQALMLAPDNDDYRIGYIKTLADARQDTAALREAQRLLTERQTPEHLQTLAYVYQRQDKGWDRLLTDTLMLAEYPHDSAMLNEWVAALSSNRVDTPAQTHASATSLTRGQYRQLDLNAAAEIVRLADLPTRTEQERFFLAQQALSRYDALLTRWQNDPDAQQDVALARLDRLGAFYANADYSAVIREYQTLLAEKQTVPDWAIGWVISAYLEQENVTAAQALLAEHPGYIPDPDDDQNALFFGMLDTGQYEAARHYVARVMQNTPWARYDYGNPIAQPNDRWLTGQSLYVQYLMQTNALPQAQALSRQLSDSAPGNQGLQIDYANVLQARGQPRAAERKLKMAEALEPSNIELESQQAYVAMDLHEWHQLDVLTDDIIARRPKDRSAQKLARLRDIQHYSELRVNAGKGLYSDNPISGSHDLSWDATLYSPPLADSWRAFAGTRFAQSHFDEGSGSARRLFGGLEWRPRDFWGEAELSSNHYHGTSKPGARIAAKYQPVDSWQFGGELERISRTTPLRALRNGISANRAEASMHWYQNERRDYRLSAAASDFSDGNCRQEYSVTGQERLWQRPSMTLTLNPEIAAGANSRADTPYYNPARDLSASASFTVDHQMYRHYDTIWSQQINAGGGVYWQKQRSPGAITLLGYGQRVQWNNVLDTGLMLNWDKRPYDGKRESNLAVTFDATLRF